MAYRLEVSGYPTRVTRHTRRDYGSFFEVVVSVPRCVARGGPMHGSLLGSRPG